MKKPKPPLDEEIVISGEPYLTKNRQVKMAKNESLFMQLKHNQRIKCHPEKVGATTAALRKWVKRVHGIERPFITSCRDYGDGYGGVWWLEGEAPYRKPRVKTKIAPKAPWYPK